MKKDHSDSPVRIGVGIPTVILILMVLGLALFATLSVKAAYSELKLARRSAEKTAEYYKADSELTQAIFTVQETIASYGGADMAGLEAELLEIQGVTGAADGVISLCFRINDRSCIEAVLTDTAGDYSELTVSSHKMYSESTDDYADTGFEIIDGGF